MILTKWCCQLVHCCVTFQLIFQSFQENLETIMQHQNAGSLSRRTFNHQSMFGPPLKKKKVWSPCIFILKWTIFDSSIYENKRSQIVRESSTWSAKWGFIVDLQLIHCAKWDNAQNMLDTVFTLINAPGRQHLFLRFHA